jgi:Zn finger protein HypA/HybF involved in hydrogenase expression
MGWSNYENKTRIYTMRKGFSGFTRADVLNPVATCVKICPKCHRFFKTDFHAQKKCDDCKELEKKIKNNKDLHHVNTHV